MAKICGLCKGSGTRMEIVKMNKDLQIIRTKEVDCFGCDGTGVEKGVGVTL